MSDATVWDAYRRGQVRRRIDSAVERSIDAKPREQELTKVDLAALEEVGLRPTRQTRFGWYFESPESPGYLPPEQR